MPPTYLDITGPNDHVTHANLDWERDGVLLLPKIIPDNIIDAYVAERRTLLGETDRWRPGWPDPTPYMRVSTMRDLALYRPLTEAIAKLQGEEPGLHLCLTGFQSTERRWHSDRYLNPETVGERYIAAWIALGDTHVDAGPFEYVAGSHKWPVIERQKVWDTHAKLGGTFHHERWPWDTEGWVGDVCEAEILARGKTVTPFIANRGDILLWHASLIHRGSLPKDKSLERRSLICHYSGIGARPDMRPPVRLDSGSYYFPF